MITDSTIASNEYACRRLCNEEASGEAIAFVGAGASAELYPLWGELINQLADEAVRQGANEEDRTSWLASKPLDALDSIRQALGRGVYVEKIREMFMPRLGAGGNDFTAVHGLLVRLHFRGFVTTNYDHGLISAQKRLQPTVVHNIATWKDTGSVNRWFNDAIFKEPGCPILFAHGIYEREDTIVLGAEDYRNAYNNRPYRKLFEKLWGQSHLVFVGFGFSDPWLEFLADSVITGISAREVASPQHIAIIGLKPHEPDCADRRRLVRAKYNADPLFYPVSIATDGSEDHSQLLAILEGVRQGSTIPLPPRPSLNPMPMQRDPNTISIGRLPCPRMNSIGRDNELDDLSKIWNNNINNIVSLIAAGGAGKSALVRTWLREMAKKDYYGAERIFGWSFESGRLNDPAASADEFIADALAFFGDSTFDQESPWANGERLADLVRKQRNLLILDGLETLQSDRDLEHGAIKDPALATLLTALAQDNPGLCIITSRMRIADLERFREHAVLIDLEKLSSQAGRHVLEEARVQGSHVQLEKTSTDFGGHALALTLFGSWLKEKYRHRDRHVYHVREIPHVEESVPEEERHAFRVMQAWAQMLQGKPSLELLYRIGLFNKPVKLHKMKLFDDKDCPRLPGLNEHLRDSDEASWWRLLISLHDAHLISFRTSNDRPISNGRAGEWVDAHPLVRAFFGHEFRTKYPDSWRSAHRWLYDWFCKNTPTHPDSLAELEPLYEAVAHGCQAGLYEVALRDVFIERIRRGREEAYSALMLGAHGADLSVISGFFKYESQTDNIAAAYQEPIDDLKDDDKAFVRGVASFSLRALGRLREACETRYLAFDASLRRHDWYGACYDAPALAETLLILGDIRAAKIMARLGVEFADRSDNELRRVDNRATLADVLHQVGRLDEAEQLFVEAEQEIQNRNSGRCSQLFLLPGFQYCDLLLSKCRASTEFQDRYKQLKSILERAKLAIALAISTKDPILGTALAQLSLGQAYLEAYLSGDSECFSHLNRAAGCLNEAVNGLRKARQQDLIPLGLLARAALHREKGKWGGRASFGKARQDLDSAMAIATSGSAANLSFGRMKLHEADVHLGYARLFLSEAETIDPGAQKTNDARERLKNATNIIRETGYHRRDVDIRYIKTYLQRV